MDRNSIATYLSQLKTDNLIDVSIAEKDINAIVTALYSLVERINLGRRNKILEDEIKEVRKVASQLGEELIQLKSLDQTHSSLLQEKEALLKEKEAIDSILHDKVAFEAIKHFVEQHNLDQLTSELAVLKEGTYNDSRQLLDFFENAGQTFEHLQTDLAQNIRVMLDVIEHNRNELRTKTNGSDKDIQLEVLHLRGYFENSENDLHTALEQYNALSQQLHEIKQKIHELKVNHSKNIQVFQIHFTHNQEIWGEMGKRHQLDEYFNTMVAELESGLQRFDVELKNAVEKADKVIIH